jgi:predicted outer membrane protein
MALIFALAAPATAADQIQVTGTGISYGASDVQMQACPKVSAMSWVEANGAAIENASRRMSLTFSEPLATDTYQASMNLAASRDLALVEIAGVDGVWHKTWEGQLQPAAPGFDKQTCFEQRLQQKQVVAALRFTFRSAQDHVGVNHAALLRR